MGLTNTERMVGLAFWTLAVMCLLNLNDLVRMWIGWERMFSVPMLALCLVALLGFRRSGPREVLGIPGLLILSCLVSYVGIGIVVSIVNGTAHMSQATWYLTRHLSSVLMVLATAAGAHLMWARMGGERVMLGLLVVLTASCGLILASPWLNVIFETPPVGGDFRMFGGFSDPNEAALVACFAVVAAVALLRGGHYRLFAFAAVVVAVTAVIGTFSRTALVVLPVLGLGAVLVTRGVPRMCLAGGMAIVAFVIPGVLASDAGALLDDRQRERIGAVAMLVDTSGRGETSLGARADLWSLGLEQALESPVFGHGLGRLHFLENAWYNEFGIQLGVHNQYLLLLGEAGIVPLVLFVSFLAVMILIGLGRGRERWALSAVGGWAAVVGLFCIAFHGMLVQRAICFILGASCGFAASALQDRAAEREAMRSS